MLALFSSTPAKVVAKQKEKLNKSFNMFNKLHDDIVNANSEIEKALEDSSIRKQALLAEIEREEATMKQGTGDIEANKALLSRIKDFVPKGSN